MCVMVLIPSFGEESCMLPHERHLSVHQVALRHNLSEDTIRRLFLSEPGVIIIAKQKPRKRIYRTLRIPESVVERVFSRFTNRAGAR